MNNISIIVAIGENNEIGKNNNLLWHISEDLKRFKILTSNKTVVMGRNTWNSLPYKPLPNRKNIVLSKNKNLIIEGVEILNSIETIFEKKYTENEIFIIGGEKVYRQFLEYADKIYITKVFQSFDADTWFPKIDENIWQNNEKSNIFYDEKSNLNYQYFNYLRKIK